MVRVDKGKREGRFCTSMAGPGFFDRLCLYPLICGGISGALDQCCLIGSAVREKIFDLDLQ